MLKLTKFLERILDYKYKGCSNDESWSNEEHGFAIASAYVTENYCVFKCDEKNFKYAGIRFDNQ